MLGADEVEAGKVGEIEQWIGGGHGFRREKRAATLPAGLAGISFDKVAIGMPRGVAEHGHDDDESKKQGREAEQGQYDDGGRP